jgi:hypothetical protein
MSKIQINELQESKSELNVLDDGQTSNVVGGYLDFDIANIVQVNNNINVQVAIGGGSNYNWSNLGNNAGADQG